MTTAIRTTNDVLSDHLRLRQDGDLATDLERNYAEDVVLLCTYGVFIGRDEAMESAHRLRLQVPGSHYEYLSCQVHGENAFLEWRAVSPKARVTDGADSYVIRDGRIQVQTIHYTLSEQ